MADETRGKFITMTCRYLETKPQVREAAIKFINEKTGKKPDDLDPEGWYPVDLVTHTFDLLTELSNAIIAKSVIKLFGRKIYPTFKANGGILPPVQTPQSMLKFEADGYLQSLRGPNVKPRTFLESKPNNIVVQADMPPGYPSEFMEGVYLGILEMCGFPGGQVSFENRSGHAVFSIKW